MKKIKCPSCGNGFDPSEAVAMPFCSERCRLIDLGRWIDEQYAFPTERLDESSVSIDAIAEQASRMDPS